MNIPLRILGKSDLQVSALGLGCWQFSKQTGLIGKNWPALTDEDTSEIVKASINGGINWFDTAEIYGQGRSEQSLSNALKKNGLKPSEAIIATKWWPNGRWAPSIKKTICNDKNVYLIEEVATLLQNKLHHTALKSTYHFFV